MPSPQSKHVSSQSAAHARAADGDANPLPVEKQKQVLTRNETLRSSVDWLTEVTFRLTDAWLNKREFSTVSMRSPMRLRKVGQFEPALQPLSNPISVAEERDALH